MRSEKNATTREKPRGALFSSTSRSVRAISRTSASGETFEHYASRYSGGWDAIRAERLARQIELGIPSCGDAAPPRSIPALHHSGMLVVRGARRGCSRAYLGFLEDELLTHRSGGSSIFCSDLSLDDTLIVLLSDNGASKSSESRQVRPSEKHMVYERESQK